MHQLSPRCASFETKAGILPSTLAANVHPVAPPKAHPCSHFNVPFMVNLPSPIIPVTRESLRHKNALIWDLKTALRWKKIESTALTKLPCFCPSAFLLLKLTQWHANNKQHLSLSCSYEKSDSGIFLGPDYSTTSKIERVAYGTRLTMEMPRPLTEKQAMTM